MPARNRKQTIAVFTAVHGEPPWDCFFCHTSITQLGQKTWDGNVHHVDGDKSNDVPENVVPAHTICHLQHHRPTEEMRRRISRKLQGRPSPTKGMKFSPEVNAKKAHHGADNHQFGKPLPQHTRDAISAANRRMTTCEKCGQEIAEHWLRRHLDRQCRPKRIIVIDGTPRVRGVEPKIKCEDCGKPYAARWMKRHKDSGKCSDIQRS